jgi:hypothetical protein
MWAAGEPPRAAAVPGTAEVAGALGRSGIGLKLPGPFRGDGLGNHRMHDILLTCGTTCSGLSLTLSLRGTTVWQRRTHRFRRAAERVRAFNGRQAAGVLGDVHQPVYGASRRSTWLS